MRIGSAIAIYFVIWWTILFAILPFGNRTQGETGEVVAGSASSAPVRPRLIIKAIVTSIVAALLLALILAIRNSGWTLDDVPILKNQQWS